MTRSGRNTPLPIQRILRQEANFGCVICGCPIIEYAHIIPYETTHDFNPKDMTVLCPTDHYRFDNNGFSEKEIRQAKASPFSRVSVQDSFFISKPEMAINLGDLKIIDTPRALVIRDFDIISVQNENGFAQFEVNFFDRFNNFVGIIYENNWVVDRTLVWDIEYKPQHLLIRNAPRQISFDVEVKDGELFLKGKLHYRGSDVEITQTEVILPGNNRLIGGTFAHSNVGISIN